MKKSKRITIQIIKQEKDQRENLRGGLGSERVNLVYWTKDWTDRNAQEKSSTIT